MITKTGLTWQKCSNGQGATSCSGTASTQDWSSALTYCSSLSLASRSWRLPNIHELLTLFDYTKLATPRIVDTVAFPNTPSSTYWTSTTQPNNFNYAVDIRFNATSGGMVAQTGKGSTARTRCVSGP